MPDILLRDPPSRTQLSQTTVSAAEIEEFGTSHLTALALRYATEKRVIAGGKTLPQVDPRGQSIYIVMDGWLVHQVLLEDGRRQILDFALPGELILPDPGTGVESEKHTEAVTDSVVAVIPRDVIPEIAKEAPEVALHFLDATRHSLHAAYESLVDTGRRTSLEAVAHFLLRLEKRSSTAYGRDSEGKVPFPLIQEHIGDAIGLTAVHVCRMLRKLKTAGFIETGRGFLKIIDHGELAIAAGVNDIEEWIPLEKPYRLAS